ncbi:hypothetical protein DQ238_19035 [Geodermatophilus sp. TF02-6]|uniref:DUF1841 family protein n=1 Tax=Geodermatophilus sp. TF02-6 TaxID=2250575 RepID=UPI000DEB1A96|nr:DUF1841 family protein [Geodermatophilus sp. TF02-6]RBY75728.1 hypothetical protein DQ238_19035 [Geodermatophilus sp. TF02-6]
MSPKSRGRKPKTTKRRHDGRRPAAQPESPTAGLLREVARELRGAAPLDAELLVSALLHDLSEQSGADSPGSAPGDPVLDLVTALGTIRSPEVLGLLRCIGLLGSPQQRALADRTARRLDTAGVAAPPWARDLGAVRPVRAWRSRDVFGDASTVAVEFERAGHRHALVVLVDHTSGGIAADAFVTDDPDELRADQDDDTAGPLDVLEDVDLADAQALLAAAFAATDADSRAEVGEDYGPTHGLALARLRTLPPGPPVTGAELLDEQAVATVTAEFLASAEAAALRGGPGVERIARLVVGSTAVRSPDGRVGTGPGRLTRLVLDRLPEEDLDDDEVAVVPDVVVAWARVAGRWADLPPEAADELVAAAEDLGTALRTASGDLTGEAGEELVASYAGDLLEDGDLDPRDLAEAVLRRVFAVPRSPGRTGNDDLAHLDPGDPDDRHLLVVAEHPEYGAAIADPSIGTVDGVDPRLHVALHEVVTNQLWDDDPPEAWQAARRLLAAGADRHDVLHELMRVAAEFLRQALHDQQPADVEAYRRALDSLGAPPARPRRGAR